MRTVLYTEDLQPIAIVELTPNEEDIIRQGSFIRIAYVPPMMIIPYVSETPRTPEADISIWGEWVSRKNTPRFILFTRSNVVKPQPALRLSELSL